MGIELEKAQGISLEQIASFRKGLKDDGMRKLMMNAVRKNGIQKVAIDHDVVVASDLTFSHEIKTGAVTNQKQSGRCWMFAGLNVLRERVAKNIGVEEFELSQAYTFFYDKLEKANYFLESILETLDEPRDGRLVAWLVTAPENDGGQWDMFVNLIDKYGIVPKSVMPETFHSSQSRGMVGLLHLKLREDAQTLREAHENGASMSELRSRKEAMMGDIYRMLTIFLGEPPESFDFEYRDKDKNFHADRGITPQDFAKKYVDVNLDDYVSVINAPTADKPYGRTFTVEYLGNVKGGRDVLYLNVDPETLRQVALKQLMDGEVVWFGCDVGQMSDRESGIMNDALYDYEGVLGVPLTLDKAGRLDYGESLMTHAMVFTGVNVVDGRPNRWKVENSWGDEPGKKGYFVMSDQWFDQYMYQVVVKKSYLSPELQKALSEPPIKLPPWDPMGSLAR